MGFVGRVVWFIKDEGANGIETRRVEIRYCAVYAEPGGDGDEVVVGRREFVSMGDISRYEVVLLRIAGGYGANIGDIEKAPDDAVESLRIFIR